MYPGLIQSLRKEKKSDQKEITILSLTWAQKAEKSHANLLIKTLALAEAGQDFDEDRLWVCKVCGNVMLKINLSEICTVCGHDSHFYQLIEGEEENE